MCSTPSLQLWGWMKKNSTDELVAPRLVLQTGLWIFQSWVGIKDARTFGIRWNAPVPEGKKDLGR